MLIHGFMGGEGTVIQSTSFPGSSGAPQDDSHRPQTLFY